MRDAIPVIMVEAVPLESPSGMRWINGKYKLYYKVLTEKERPEYLDILKAR